ncbi:MAG: hypothetical protein RLZZ428_632 [Pseudomonadota bacterium]|jgi:HD superfamily phosphohydrolase
MNHQTNRIFSKPFLKTLFWKQNKHHQHGVLLHTLRVAYHTLKGKDFKMLSAALLHDIGKPVVSYQKEEDVALGEYSFTDHEEKSYQIIKRWWWISDYTKILVRYHYLIRDISKHQTKDPIRYQTKLEIWESLDPQIQADLKRFLHYDDLGKGTGAKSLANNYKEKRNER